MHDELKKLFLREDILDTVNYLIVNQKIANLSRENYAITGLHFEKDLLSCQIVCKMNVYFQSAKTSNAFLELMDYLQQIGLVSEISYSWFPETPLSFYEDKKITKNQSISIFFDFKMLDRDYFNVV